MAIYALLFGRVAPAFRQGVVPDSAKTLLVLNRSIVQQGAWIAVRGHELIGSIGCILAEAWFGNMSSFVNLWFWINEDERSFPVARALVRSAWERAKVLGLPFEIGTDSGHDITRKQWFYAKLGLRQVGSHFVGA